MDTSEQHAPPQQTLLQFAMGYWVSQAVGSAARLGVPDALAKGPKTAKEIAPQLKLNADALYRLLRCCAHVGVFTMDKEGRFGLSPVGELLQSGVPGSMRGFLCAETANGHWAPWGRLDEAVRTGQRQTRETLGMEIWEYYAKNKAEGEWFSQGMAGLSEMVAQEFLRVHDFKNVKRVVDVGGAFGALAAAVLKEHPHTSAVIYDLPQVVEGARAALQKSGLAQRCEVVGGDFFKNVPSGADAYLLKTVLHDWNDDECVAILKNCASAMAKDGSVVVLEMVIPPPGEASPSPAAILDLNMMVMLTGRERTAEEYAQLFARAGLKLANVTPTFTPFVVIEAKRA